jgi:hypothetical protein
MNKECRPSPPMRRRRITNRSLGSKASKLEEKLDGLVTLLRSAPGIISAASLNIPIEGFEPSSHDVPHNSTAVAGVLHQDYIYNKSLPNSRAPESGNTSAASFSSDIAAVNIQRTMLSPCLLPSPEEAESYLNKFRFDFVKHLPFIVIPPSVTSEELRQDRPILWVCIMTSASSNSSQQNALSKEVRAIIGREAFVEGTRNMDLLLGILVCAAW